MWRVWLKRALLLALAALVLFIFGWVPWWLAGLATTRRFVYHDRENGGLTPAAYAGQLTARTKTAKVTAGL